MRKLCLRKGTCGLLLLLFLGSCSVDSSYDLSKDIDLTMALGGNGLALKLGNTEKMYLRDILKTNESSLLDTITSGDNLGLYYLVESGSSNFNVNVDSIAPFEINPISARTNALYAVPQDVSGANFYKDTLASAKSNLNIAIPNIPVEVKEVHSVSLSNAYATIQLSTDNSKFKITSYTDLKVKLPDFVESSLLNSAHEYVVSGSSETITIPIQTLEFPVDGSFGHEVLDGEIQQDGEVSLDGNIRLSTDGTVDLSKGETVKVVFNVTFSKISPQQITGLVDPTLNIDIDPIQIRSELPQFLKDDSVRFSVTNPTVKLSFNGENLPFPLLFKGILESRVNSQVIASVSVPQSGRVSIPKGSTSVSYFSQASTPFDPYGVDASANKETVTDLNSLITKLPEQITVDFNDGKVIADQSAEHSIYLGQDYGVGVDYEIFIPFQFDKDLQVLYNDSVVDMNKDLKDYQAEGLTITATALNAIPLNLLVEIIPYDVDGNVISGISVESATIASGTLDSPKQTEVSVKFSPTSPAYVSEIEKLKFKFTASASDLATGEVLLSTQYIQMNDLRIKLNGTIITNFN
jgi:hypothetical protein